jgi:membrane protein DedA with SNARE-associated domain
MSLETLITNYGYAAIGIGTFFEGETILILGGLAAHGGYLQLHWVIVSAFLGTLFGDQLYFYIGRFKGQEWLERKPAWEAKSQRVFDLLERYQILFIIGFRFVYGLRTITPFVIGVSGIPPLRYLLLNALGGLLWAVVIGTAGYLFGNAVEMVMGDIKLYEMWVLGGIAALGASVWLVYIIRGRVHEKRHDRG